ncbi:MAG: hypothetical protein AYK23_03015 [Candidatus Proteinoplasmatales archaeon SG8-5]|nr:MAG: hypothetical protein AYK23_03015 [Candidatus Proteinoplasmatales archaeon SG8-5]
MTRRLEEAAEEIRNHSGRTRIFSHYDPDGITAAAIICKVMLGLGKPFKVTLTKKLDDKRVKEAGETPNDQLIIFADMGATRVSQLDDFPHKVIVVDHHEPEAEGENIIHVNPHFFDIDGAREASAASFAFSLASTVDERNWSLASLAIAGAIGDRQNLGGFQGYNEELVAAAAQRELISIEVMPDLKGHTIFESLTEHPEPYFVDITGRKQKASRFMKWLGLDKESEFKSLEEEQKRFLTSICAMRLLRQGATPEAILNFVTERYWLYDWDMYADELTSLFNACSRQGDQATGLAMALGDRAAREAAAAHRLKHQEWIIENLRKLEVDPPESKRHLQYFYAAESSYAGVLAGLGTLYFFDDSKATFGIHKNGGNLNVSARAPRSLVEAGVNLGVACRKAGEAVGGSGGGHDIAAGATVPSKREKKFLSELDKILKEQLTSRNSE